MSGWVLIPFGSAFLRASTEEFAVMMGRGLDPGPSGHPVAAPVAAEGLLTSAQLGERLALTSTFCEQKAASGEWPCHRPGRYLRFRLSEVLAAIAANGSGVAHD
ncbi:MAG: hypothetical protein AB7O21_20095 [Gammaproteobacteria bacterium]